MGSTSIKRKPVSALIPIHNGAQWIDNLNWYLNLTLREQDEIIIVDDGSTDETQRLLRLKTFPCEIKVLRISRTGLVGALNQGLAKCSNDFVARYDVDDRYQSERVDATLQAFKPGVCLSFSDYKFTDLFNARNLGQVPSPLFPIATKLSLIRSQRTAHPSAIYCKESVFRAGGYREEDFPSEDVSLWLRMSNFGQIVSIGQVLLSYTLRKGSITSSNNSHSQSKLDFVLSKYMKLDELKNEIIATHQETLDSYDLYSRADERKMLYLYDLLHPKIWQLFSRNERKVLRLSVFRSIDKLASLKGITGMTVSKARRDIYRKLITN